MFWTVEKQYAKFLITMRMSFPMFWCSNHAPKEIQQSVIWIRIIIALDMLFFFATDADTYFHVVRELLRGRGAVFFVEYIASWRFLLVSHEQIVVYTERNVSLSLVLHSEF